MLTDQCAKSRQEERTECRFMLPRLNGCASDRARPRVNESLCLPGSTFISAAIGNTFQGLQLFVCRMYGTLNLENMLFKIHTLNPAVALSWQQRLFP